MRKGVSLIEVLVVMAILAILAAIMLGTLNPTALVNRAHDATRKKDIGRIKIAFEEYFTDKGCYPSQDLINTLDCGSTDFNLWLAKWPCDPDGSKYIIGVNSSDSDCPNQYRILTNLKNKEDVEIPEDWYSGTNIVRFGDGLATVDEVNFGVSSTNINWYDQVIDPMCETGFKQCYRIVTNGCTALAANQTYANAYIHPDCLPQCQVSCCRNGNICN